MVYIKDWPEFQARSIKLYQQNPHKTRYLLKSRASAHSLTLKVTDDTTTIKYRTRSSAILGRLEIFNKAMMFAMAGSNQPLVDATPEQQVQTAPGATSAGAASVPVTGTAALPTGASVSQNGSAPPPPAGATPSASDKKKKKKKGKK